MTLLSRNTLGALVMSCVLAACGTVASYTDTKAKNMMKPLTITTFNPGANSIFPVTSSLLEGETEVALIDAQFQKNDAQTLVSYIKKSGKKLTTVYISHGDPDFYFGLEVVKSAFPDAAIVSSASTKAYIEKTMIPKLKHWGPILKANAPATLIVPDVLAGDTFWVDGREVKVIGLNGHDPKHTFLWVSVNKAILGGVSLFNNMHAWLADSKTVTSRNQWHTTLASMAALQPEQAIAGHYLGELTRDVSAIEFTRIYLNDFEQAAGQSQTSEQLIGKMKAQYPVIGGDALLDLSAKVITGDMQWP